MPQMHLISSRRYECQPASGAEQDCDSSSDDGRQHKQATELDIAASELLPSESNVLENNQAQSSQCNRIEENDDPESFYLSPNVNSVADQLHVAKRNKCSTFLAADIKRAILKARQQRIAPEPLQRDDQLDEEVKVVATATCSATNSNYKLNGKRVDFKGSLNFPRISKTTHKNLQEPNLLKNGTHLLDMFNNESETFLKVPTSLNFKSVALAAWPASQSDLNLTRKNTLASVSTNIPAGVDIMSVQQVEHQEFIQPNQIQSVKFDRAASLGALSANLNQQQQALQSNMSSTAYHHRPLQNQPNNATTLERDSATLSTNKIGRIVGKKASRVKELLLQNLGRADRTTDQLFELYEENFYKQQSQANKLSKELKQYMSALKGFHEASRSLNKCIQIATSDYQALRHDLVCENLSQLEQLNDDLVDKLREQVMQTVGEYLSQFVELKEKISKRKRKLIDFDGSKRLYDVTLAQVNKRRLKLQQQQANESTGGESHGFGLKFLAQQHHQTQSSESLAASQLVDEARLLKLREQYNYSKIMYETINRELHEELPIMYEKKMKSLLMTMQNYFALEAQYHSKAGKLLATASDVIDELPSGLMSHTGLNSRRDVDANDGGDSNDVEDDDDDDDDDDGDDDDGDEYARDCSSSKEMAEKSNAVAVASNGGGSSSGLGSSRADSSSCPETCSSSSSGAASGAGSPDSVARMREQERSEQAETESGKADEPANNSAVGEHHTGLDASSDGSNACGGYAIVGQRQHEQEILLDEQQQQGQYEGSHVVVVPETALGDRGKVATVIGSSLASISLNDETHDDVKPQHDDESFVANIKAPETELNCHDDSQETDDCDKSGVDQSAYLYKVKTNYKYLAEDVDELCFEADEIIRVIEFDESHEPEEGWLLGIREVNGLRGLFPANFTRPI